MPEPRTPHGEVLGRARPRCRHEPWQRPSLEPRTTPMQSSGESFSAFAIPGVRGSRLAAQCLFQFLPTLCAASTPDQVRGRLSP